MSSGFINDDPELKVQGNVAVEEVDTKTDRPPHMDPKTETKLTRKLDRYLIPVLGLLYLLSFLDRGNIGSANVASPSLTESLGLTSNQYAAAVSVVYATYVVFEPLWSNLLKIMTPKVVLAGSTVIWGGLTLATAWAKNYHGLLAIRILLGAFEAGLFPCISVYIFMTYRREEFGRRMSYIFGCSAASGAFGGLIAYGLIQIENGKLVGWQYLYIVEGILSIAAGPLAYFWIPDRVDRAWFLNETERDLCIQRYEFNKANYNPDEQFSFKEVVKGLSDWKTYCTGTIQFCADITLYGLSTFMPAIIKGMGYSNVHAQLLTVPVYVLAALSFFVIAHFSDKYNMRSPFIALAFVFHIVGYAILASVKSVHGRYAGVFVCSLGLYVIPGLNVTWVSGNTAGHYKRVTAFGVNQLIGNSSGAAIGAIYSSKYAPRYLKSIHISIGLSGVGLLITGVTAFNFWRLNRKHQAQVDMGAPDQQELGDCNPHFRYQL